MDSHSELLVKNSSTKERRDELVRHCRSTAKLACRTARILAEHSSKQRYIQHLMRTLNFVIGAIVVAYSLLSLETSSQQPPSHQGAIIATFVAAALLLDAALPTVMQEPNPDRFKDYAY